MFAFLTRYARYATALMMLLPLLTAAGCREALFTRSDGKFLMGTYTEITVYSKDPKRLLDGAYALMEELIKQIDHRSSEGDIGRLNAAAGKKEWISVEPSTIQVLQKANEVSHSSGGLFDLSVGPLTTLWKIGEGGERVPSSEEIRKALLSVGYENILTDAEQNQARLALPGMFLDLGGVGKGFITDEIAAYLRTKGAKGALINLGGNLLAIGKKSDGSPWKVGLQDPFRSPGVYLGELDIRDISVVTSGVYARTLVVDGKFYPHILDPNSGYPIDTDIRSVTILSESSLEADELSTATLMMGLKKGWEYAQQQGVGAIFITDTKEIYLTPNVGDFKLTNKQFTLRKAP